MGDIISIIVPIYRVEQYLDQCIQSIQNQTYKDLEIILVDDGSDDQCPQICDRYAQHDKRIKVIHKKNGGIDSARKAGISIATGKYVGYVDGDDWIESVMYEQLLAYAHQYEVDIVESGAVEFWGEKEKTRTSYLAEGCYKGKDFVEKVESKILYAGVFFQFGISPYMWSKLFLREKLMNYQMIEDLTNIVHNDTMVALPCITEAKNVYISHNCYYHYRVRTSSLKRKCRTNEVANLLECYPQFYTRFKGTVLLSEGDKQIKYYTMYWLLYRAPEIFDDPHTEDMLMPFGGVRKNAHIILYGAGSAGIHLENYIRNLEGSNIVSWVDRNYKDLQNTLDVKNPKEIMNYEYDYIVISILRENAVESAKRDLINLGVPEDKIRWIEHRYIDNPELLLSKAINVHKQ